LKAFDFLGHQKVSFFSDGQSLFSAVKLAFLWLEADGFVSSIIDIAPVNCDFVLAEVGDGCARF
jgi:hypothetical protein